MVEIWKDIKGFEGIYQVSNTGKVKSLERVVKTKNGHYQSYNEKILKTQKTGYCLVMLCKERKIYPRAVHRLVAQTFIPNPENKPFIDHIDTNPQNNSVDNLRWVTQKENCLNPISRKNNSESKKGHRGYLTHHTEESKKKMSESKKGKKPTDEQRKHMSEARKRYLERKKLEKEGGIAV